MSTELQIISAVVLANIIALASYYLGRHAGYEAGYARGVEDETTKGS